MQISKIVRTSNVIVLMGLLAFFTAACQNKPSKPNLTVGPAANDQGTTMEKGQILEIRLPSNPSTGYRWVRMGPLTPNMMRPINHNYEPPNSDLLGAEGTDVFQWETYGPGLYTINYSYRKSATSNDADKGFKYTVTVK